MRQNKLRKTWRSDLKRNYALYLFVLPAFIEVLIFSYFPMYGVQIAFKNFKPALGIWDSAWVGMKWFTRFFNSYQAVTVIANTVILSVLLLLFSFPISIIFALIVNQYRSPRFRRTVQTVSYAPHFISTVVIAGMITIFLSPSQGLYGNLCNVMGIEAGNPMGEASLFRPIYIISEIWQHTGWESIIYVAALSSIDPGLYDAATVDGANRYQRIRHIEIPALASTAVLIFIMRVGSVMSMGFEKVYLLPQLKQALKTRTYHPFWEPRVLFCQAISLFLNKLEDHREKIGHTIQRAYSSDQPLEIRQMSDILTELVRAFCIQEDAQRESNENSPIYRSLSYIQQEIGSEQLSLVSVAEYVRLSPAHYSSLFHHTLNYNFKDYVTMLRMNKARRILRDTPDVPVAEVARQVGYGNTSSFGRLFKKQTGITPNEYRIQQADKTRKR